MDDVELYLPTRVNDGSFLTAYTLNQLRERIPESRIVLPLCSLGTPVDELRQLGPLVLPPLYHEALDQLLKGAILDQVLHCFPYYEGTRARQAYEGKFEVVELPEKKLTPMDSCRVLAFSVDTAVEEHGPHLPLMTDTIQSYGVLRQLAAEFEELVVGPPVEYGHLTWGLPFGLSIDITPILLTRYVERFTNAMLDWFRPDAIYVVDVHGSIVHRNAIQEGLNKSRCERWAFRWLHEPLVQFAGDRGDQHAGGVETSLVQFINPDLVDATWWPDRAEELVDGQMSLADAVALTPELPRFIARVESGGLNGIVGDIRNFFQVDPQVMMQRMVEQARSDVQRLLSA
jgi:creatinine amidohydrolase